MTHYIGIIHNDTGTDFGVSFPDFPGCITVGRDLDEARAMAEKALAFHVEGMLEDGEPLPSPSTFEKAMEDSVNREGVAVWVPLRVAALAVS